MNKTLATIITIAVVVGGVLALLASSVKLATSKLYFNFNLAGISRETNQRIEASDIWNIFKQLAAQALTGKSVNIKIDNLIRNNNKFKINFSDLFVQLFYNNELIASSAKVDINKYTIPAEGKLNFIEDIQLFINPTTIQIAEDIIQKKPVKINYTIKSKVFNIPISQKDSFTI